MVEAAVDFVRKKQPRLLLNVKILIFQTAMMADFHQSMRSREGEEVHERSVFTKFKGRGGGRWKRCRRGGRGRSI